MKTYRLLLRREVNAIPEEIQIVTDKYLETALARLERQAARLRPSFPNVRIDCRPSA